MKKIILSVFAVCAVTISSNAQSFDWVKQIEGNNAEQVYSVSSNGSDIYSTGTYNGISDFDPGAGTQTLSTIGGYDFFVQKLDQNGDFLWCKSLGGTGDDAGRVINDYGTSVIISGTFSESMDFDPGTGVEARTSNGGTDIFILALDSNGDFLWVETFGGPNNESMGGQELNSSDNMIITGGYDANMLIDVNGTPINFIGEGMMDVFFLQMNLTTGNIDWVKSIGSTNYDAGSGVVVKSNNNFIITGRYRNIMDIDPTGTNFSLSSDGGNSVFLIEYDEQGEFINGFTFDSNSDMEAYAIELDDNENIFLGGYFKATVDFDVKAGVTDVTTNGAQDCYVVKLTPTKDLVWAKTFGGTGVDQVFGLQVASNGDVYTVGRFNNVVDFDPGAGTTNETAAGSSWDVFIHTLNASGDFQMVHTIGDSGTDLAKCIDINPAGDIYIVGTFAGTADFNPGSGTTELTADGTSDGFLIKYSDLAAGINSLSEKSTIKLYPNPVQNQLFIESEKGQVLEMNILDISGKEIRSITNNNVNSIDVSNLNQGVYILKVTTENGISTNRFIKQ